MLFLPSHDFSMDWKVERGHFDPLTLRPFTDAECDLRERMNAERAEEERGWTRSYFQRLFGIRTASSRSPAKGPEKEAVREAASVLNLLAARGIEHRVVGGNAVFRCPFHDDRRPSATFSLKKKVFFCHPCGEGSDVFGFIQRLDGVPFNEAVEIVHRIG